MLKSQIAQTCFVIFTIVQIVLFIFFPEVYGGLMKDMESPPYFLSLRLIGVKEVGLMLFYTVGIILNDTSITWLTVCGRSTTLLFTPFCIYVLNAPNALWGGVIQDILATSITTYFLVNEKPKPKRKVLPLDSLYSFFPRFLALVLGIIEFIYGMTLFIEPFGQKMVVFEIYKDGFNVRSFAYMTILCGLYSISVAILPKLDGLVYLSVGLHHISFYLLTRFGLSALLNTPFTPSMESFYASLALVASVGVVLVLPERKKYEKGE